MVEVIAAAADLLRSLSSNNDMLMQAAISSRCRDSVESLYSVEHFLMKC